jgi:hypothetical protein
VILVAIDSFITAEIGAVIMSTTVKEGLAIRCAFSPNEALDIAARLMEAADHAEQRLGDLTEMVPL